ncbi:MAG TPA: hypothetical protein IAC04_04030 [Candidatus Coprenecus stercoravium]|uniref:Uncharacterized protein n=1 Tax=Candidatus Coprenecus stercoravium TaxID=2840735 RepID=A0A9D2KA70_9BACT|nr:hypothetical protein [Candidatus Coprenecus stercoravium]
MKKLIFTLCAVFCAVMFSFDASAQDQEIVKLKDGTEITGIIKRLPDGGVRVTDSNGDTFVFAADEIALITNAEQKAKQEKAEKRKNSGYAGIVEAGVGYSLNYGPYFSVGMINAYKFSPYFYIGVGVDFRTTSVWSFNDDVGYIQSFAVPIYLHLRYSMLGGRLKNKVSPFIACNVGYDVAANVGMLLEPYVGIEIKNLKKGALWLAFDLPVYIGEGGLMDIGLKAGWSF